MHHKRFEVNRFDGLAGRDNDKPAGISAGNTATIRSRIYERVKILLLLIFGGINA